MSIQDVARQQERTNRVVLAHQRKMREIAKEISDFRAHLASEEFTGAEDGDRKDWISTADVDRWLAGLLSKVNE